MRNWLGVEQVLTYPQPAIKLTNGVATWLHFDHLGSVRAITDATGAKVESAIYRPFGEQSEWLLPGNASPETKGRTRDRYDADAGLQYLNARYYDPALGMFLQPDWFEVTKPGVGTNRFSYSFNDPVNKFDPGGNQTNDETMGDEFDSPSCEESGGCDYRLQNWASRIGRNLRAAWDNPLEALSGMLRGTVQDLAFGVENLPSSPFLGPVGTMAGAAQDLLDSCKGSSGCDDYVYGEMTDAQQGGYLIGSVATGAAGLARAGIKGLAKTVEQVADESFFTGTRYTNKVLTDMSQGVGEFHSFPEAVVAFEKSGTIRTVTGNDGVVREMLEIPGSYTTDKGRVVDGVFQFMKEMDGFINHRLFVARP